MLAMKKMLKTTQLKVTKIILLKIKSVLCDDLN